MESKGNHTPLAAAGPLISIIVVVFNGAAEIQATLESAFVQNSASFEVVVIDGGSKDGTLLILDSYRSRLAVCISEPDRGIYDAMNKGVSHARGEWLYFLNCGDRFAQPDVLARIEPELLRTRYSLIVGRVNYMSGTKIIKQLPDSVPRKNTARKLFWSHFCHQALFVRRSASLAAGAFDTRFPVFADFHNSYQVIRDCGGFGRIDVTIAEFDSSGISGNFRRGSQLYREVEAVFSSLGEPRSRFAFRLGLYRMRLYQLRQRLLTRLSQ